MATWGMSETPTSKSGISAAAWSAIAAIAVAVIGGVVTLTTAWWQHAPPKPAAAASASVTPQPMATAAQADPASWKGSWTGVVQAPGEAPFAVQVTIAEGCALNSPCGSIRVPKCVGRLTLARLGDAGEAEFNVADFDASSDPEVCKPGGGEVLKAGADGTLTYTATYSGATGVLRRP
jgi:hypothetical protein